MSLNYLKSCTSLLESCEVFRKIPYQICRGYYENRNMLRLRERDMFHDIFPEQCCNEIHDYLCKQPRYVYAGFDPTASSLHIGNLLILKHLIHWQRSGHRVIVLIGNATALIGDPSGRSTDREYQSAEEVREQGLQIRRNIEQIFQNHENFVWSKVKNASPLPPVTYLNNMDWYGNINVVDFLNKIGRHFRMGPMLLKDSVRRRIDSDSGMCFPEFTYQIFQAYDWYHLYKAYDCKFQIGGKDQMGNMESGHRLIRRILNEPSYALTLPLITNDAGDKFGKSVPNAVWLDSELTSPFEFYQFFIRLPDADVYKLIKYFSFKPCEEINSMIEKHKEEPSTRFLQKILAEEITQLIHGDKGLESARRTTDALYSNDVENLGKLDHKDLQTVLKGSTIVECRFRPGYKLIDFALDIRCFLAKTDAHRIITAGGFHVNYAKAQNPEEIITQSVHILPNNITHVRVGKRNIYVVKWIFDSI